jgi:hypothetical protein
MATTHFPAECPRCQTGLRVRREYLGQWVCCRYCGQVFQAGAPLTEAEVARPGPGEVGPGQPHDHDHDHGPNGDPDADGGVTQAGLLAVLRAERDEARGRAEALAREAAGAVEAERQRQQAEADRQQAEAAARHEAQIAELRRAHGDELARESARAQAASDRWDHDRRDLADQLERLRRDRDADRDTHRQALDALRQAHDGGSARAQAERDHWERERRDLADQLERLRRDRDAERDSHRQALGTLREAHDADRLQADRERSALQALADRLRAEAEAAALRLAEFDDRLRALAGERDALREEAGGRLREADALGRDRDALRRSLDEALAAAREADARHRTEAEALAASAGEARRDRDALRAEADRLRSALAEARSASRAQAQARARARATADPPPGLRFPPPVLCRDLARWSAWAAAGAGPRPVVARPVGPPLPPPTLDDIETADRQVEMLRSLLRTPAGQGKPFHSLFDLPRFQALQAKLREAALLAERLVNQVERSRNQKDLLWHLMVAQRNDEIQRNKRR